MNVRALCVRFVAKNVGRALLTRPTKVRRAQTKRLTTREKVCFRAMPAVLIDTIRVLSGASLLPVIPGDGQECPSYKIPCSFNGFHR